MTFLNMVYLSFVLISLLSTVLIPEQTLALVETPKPSNSDGTNCTKQQFMCGNISIQYPFSTEDVCPLDPNFSILCNTTFDPPRAFIKSVNNLELLSMSVLESKFEVKIPVLSNCLQVGRTSNSQLGLDLQFVPFSLPASDNIFTAMGCDNLALLMKEGRKEIIGGCMSYCDNKGVLNRSRELSNCHGLDCCQTTTPWALKTFDVKFQGTASRLKDQGESCSHAIMAKKSWLESSSEANISAIDLSGVQFVPAVLDWIITNSENYGSCTALGSNYNGLGNNTTNICGPNAYCSNSSSSEGYVCLCYQGYTGNPYDKCTDAYNTFRETSCNAMRCNISDIDECVNVEENNPCGKGRICTNTPGAYKCSCPYGYNDDGISCNPIPYEYIWILTMIGQGGGLMLLLACLWCLDREYTKRKKIRLKKTYFKRNGGPLLQKTLSSSEDTVKKIELFSSKELKHATDNYNIKRIIGRGGQGTIFLGMLTDGRIVAVKQYKHFEPSKVEQFINEVIILSKINHRNVVKIFGCCLETEFPQLVYEFIPNGTLFRYIQDRNEKYFPFSWDMRLQIAAEIAEALCYLHWEASTSIFHRDIKSTNILLDDRFRAKVADFGISMSISIDETHKSTMVRGTFGYLDPEYFRSKQFTDKSDVYSFGVILIELITGLEPIFSNRTDNENWIGLAPHFEVSVEKGLLLSIVDARIVKVASKKEITAIANLARRCLNLYGRNRPTMKEVAMELGRIRMNR